MIPSPPQPAEGHLQGVVAIKVIDESGDPEGVVTLGERLHALDLTSAGARKLMSECGAPVPDLPEMLGPPLHATFAMWKAHAHLIRSQVLGTLRPTSGGAHARQLGHGWYRVPVSL